MTTLLKRIQLLQALTLVRPALAPQPYIPALTHVRMSTAPACVTAYNDILSISVSTDSPWNLCLPGDLFIKALNSLTSDTVKVQVSEGEQSVVLTSGRAKLKLPALPVSDFHFTAPSLHKSDSVPLSADLLLGLSRCLLNVGNDPTHPEQMGVTLDRMEDGTGVLYSTDNFTLSRYVTTELEQPAGMEWGAIILPTLFCQQLVNLNKAFPDQDVALFVLPGMLLAKIGESATVSTKTLVTHEPLEFAAKLEKHGKVKRLKSRVVPIPTAWEGAFERAMLVLSTDLEKVTKVDINSEALRLHSTSPMGDSDDAMAVSDGWHPEGAPSESFYLDPSLVLRTSKVCTHMAFTETAIVLTDQNCKFVHVIAYCSK